MNANGVSRLWLAALLSACFLCVAPGSAAHAQIDPVGPAEYDVVPADQANPGQADPKAKYKLLATWEPTGPGRAKVTLDSGSVYGEAMRALEVPRVWTLSASRAGAGQPFVIRDAQLDKIIEKTLRLLVLLPSGGIAVPKDPPEVKVNEAKIVIRPDEAKMRATLHADVTFTGGGRGTERETTQHHFLLLPRSAPPLDRYVYKPRPITAAQVDKFLDYLAGQLEVAAQGAKTPKMIPTLWGSGSPAYAPGKEPMTRAQAADLARAVWEEVQSLMRLANGGAIPVNAQQKKRLRVFGHWAAWVIRSSWDDWRVPEEKGPYLEFGPVRVSKLAQVPVNPPEPPYPLFGRPADDVPPPPFRIIADVPEEVIYDEEYTQAFLLTLFQAADCYYTRGLLFTTYLAVSENECRPIALAVLCNLPKIGPWFGAALVGYYELGHFTDLTWDQHVGNLSTLLLMGADRARAHDRVERWRANPRPKEVVNPAKGINEGGVPGRVGALFGRRSYRLTNRETLPSGVEVADLECAISGKLLHEDGRVIQGWGADPVPLPARRVKIVHHEGIERYFDLRTGEPIIPHNEPGYHAWSHLTERKCGYPTGEASLETALKGTPYEAEIKGMIQAYQRPDANLAALNVQYAGLMGRLLNDYRTNRLAAHLRDMDSGYYYYNQNPSFDQLRDLAARASYPEAVYFLKVRNSDNELNLIKLVVAVKDEGKLINVYVQNASAKPPQGRVGHNFWAPLRQMHPNVYTHTVLRAYLNDMLPLGPTGGSQEENR